MVNGLKKLITKHGYQNFIFGVWYLIPFLSSFYNKKKVAKECLKKKRAKWPKGKERLQIANNHSYCLDVSIFFIGASSRGLKTESV